MSVFRQALHVIRFDAQRLRWWFLAYVVIVGASLAMTLGPPDRPRTLAVAVSFLVMLAAVFAAAIIVGDDSPVRGDAYWASKPLSSDAMVSSKVATMLLLGMVLPMAALAIALAWFDVTVHEMLIVLAWSAWSVLTSIVVVMGLAATSRDLRTVPLLLLLAAVLS